MSPIEHAVQILEALDSQLSHLKRAHRTWLIQTLAHVNWRTGDGPVIRASDYYLMRIIPWLDQLLGARRRAVMRYDAEHKQRTRRKVLHEAAAAIRQRGPERIGVAHLMARAGLTHGAFYAHFTSKAELVAEAITAAFDDRYEFFVRSFVEAQEPAAALAAFVDRYLSAAHRDAVPTGCPLPCLSGDASRLPLAARQRFTAGTARLVRATASLLQAAGKTDAAGLAVSMLAEMVGALALSRAVVDVKLSDRILTTSRDAINRRTGLEGCRDPTSCRR